MKNRRIKNTRINELIPHGDYCYTVVSDWISEEGRLPHFKTCDCPFFRGSGNGENGDGDCLLFKENEVYGDGSISDQVKICGINPDFKDNSWYNIDHDYSSETP